MKLAQMVSVLLGIFLVVLACLAFSTFYGSGWTIVANQTAGASLIVGMFACVLGILVSIMWGKN
jgi:uncharacterized membrane protein